MLALSRKTSNLDLNPKEKKNQKRKEKKTEEATAF